MNKKIIITISTILGLTVIVGGFLIFQKTKNQGMENNQQKQKIEVVENDENESKQDIENQEKDKTEIENIKTTPQLSPKEIEKLKQEKDLVWYEIPELGIKFLVKKQMVDLIGYRDYYVEASKVHGKELYVVDFAKQYYNGTNNLDVFGKILKYKLATDGVYLENNTVKLKDICKYILLKNKRLAFCYVPDIAVEWNKKNGNYNEFNSQIKALFDGYLMYTYVDFIQK